MKEFRHTVEQFSALRFVSQEVEFCSSIGRHAMLDTPWMTSPRDINAQLDKVECFYGYIDTPHLRKGVEELELVLGDLVNVSGSIQLLKERDSICTDIDFFELKKLALIEEKARVVAERFAFDLEPKPKLTKVLDILDPESQRLPTFFLSSVFHPELSLLRKRQEAATDEIEQGRLAEEIAVLEDKVRYALTRELSVVADDLSRVLKGFAQDVLSLGKAKWAIAKGATRPTPIENGVSRLTHVVHPEVKYRLEEKGLSFQPVSLEYSALPTLITGANMAGKSVLLASVALSQLLMQYGWYVPAAAAELAVVDDVMLSVGDGQDVESGLSSFGAELMNMNAIIKAVKEGKQVLALIDEPARSTNPTEGHALVSGLVKLLKRYQVRAIITTHYSNIDVEVRRWRVKGFVEERLLKPMKMNQLNQCIDYTLIEEQQDQVPQEAFRIAEILGVDEELLEMCKSK